MTKTMPMVIACFGLPGSYTYEAMMAYFDGKDIEPRYASQFEDVVQAVARRRYVMVSCLLKIPRLVALPMCTISFTAMIAILPVKNTCVSNIIFWDYRERLWPIYTKYTLIPRVLPSAGNFLKEHENWLLHLFQYIPECGKGASDWGCPYRGHCQYDSC